NGPGLTDPSTVEVAPGGAADARAGGTVAGDAASGEVAGGAVAGGTASWGGFPPARGAGQGVGLNNTAERLRALYGAAQSMTLGAGRLGGVLVAIRIPYHEHPRPAGPHPRATAAAQEAAWTGSAS